MTDFPHFCHEGFVGDSECAEEGADFAMEYEAMTVAFAWEVVMPIRRHQHRGQGWLEVPIEGQRNVLLRAANFQIWAAGGGGECGVEILWRV